MSPFRRSTRRGMIVGAAVASSRANKKAAAAATPVAAAQPQPASTSVVSNEDTVTQLKQFAQLRDQGILTDAEFEAKKKQLLGL